MYYKNIDRKMQRSKRQSVEGRVYAVLRAFLRGRLAKDFTQKFLAYHRLPLPRLQALQPLHRGLTLRPKGRQPRPQHLRDARVRFVSAIVFFVLKGVVLGTAGGVGEERHAVGD